MSRKAELLPSVGSAMAQTPGADDYDKKVADLYEMCYRWRAATAALPSILDRLRSLKSLHQHGGSFAARLQGEWAGRFAQLFIITV
jgi:hypothetical protein